MPPKTALFAHISIMIHYDIILQILIKVKRNPVKNKPIFSHYFVIRDDFFAQTDKI